MNTTNLLKANLKTFCGAIGASLSQLFRTGDKRWNNHHNLDETRPKMLSDKYIRAAPSSTTQFFLHRYYSLLNYCDDERFPSSKIANDNTRIVVCIPLSNQLQREIIYIGYDLVGFYVFLTLIIIMLIMDCIKP